MLTKAIKLASQMKSDRFRHCAIITDKKGKILSIGYNSFDKSHPRQKYWSIKATGNVNKIFLHSELDAIVKLKDNQIPYAIYVARVNRQGAPLPSCPCEICSLAIKDLKIKKVYHT